MSHYITADGRRERVYDIPRDPRPLDPPEPDDTEDRWLDRLKDPDHIVELADFLGEHSDCGAFGELIAFLYHHGGCFAAEHASPKWRERLDEEFTGHCDAIHAHIEKRLPKWVRSAIEEARMEAEIERFERWRDGL